MDTPEVSSKWKCRSKRGTFSFVGVGGKGDVVWWNFIDIDDGKYHAFYPDEVYPAGQKRAGSKKNTSKKPKMKIEKDKPAKAVTIDGETISIV